MDENSRRYNHVPRTPRPQYGVPRTGRQADGAVQNQRSYASTREGLHRTPANTAHTPVDNQVRDERVNRTPANTAHRPEAGTQPATRIVRKRKLTRKGMLKRAALGGIALLLLLIIIAIGSGSKNKIHGTSAEVAQETYTEEYVTKALLNIDDGVTYLDFIDNDYASQGIKKSSNAYFFDADNNKIKCVNFRFISPEESTPAQIETLENYLGVAETSTATDAEVPEDDGDGKWVVSFTVEAGQDTNVQTNAVVELHIITQEKQVLVVPSSAVFKNSDGDDSVIVITDKKKAEVTAVKAGAKMDVNGVNYTVVTSGLSKDQTVLVTSSGKALDSIKTGSKIKATPANTNTETEQK